MAGRKLLRATVRIHKGAYVGRFFFSDGPGYIERVLKFEDQHGHNVPLKASPGAKVKCGHLLLNPGLIKSMVIEDESPDIISMVTFAAGATGGELAATGELRKDGRLIFEKAMGLYLAWHLDHRNDHNIDKKARACVAVFGPKRINAITREEVRSWITGLIDTGKGYYYVRNLVGCARACYNWLDREQLFEGRNPFEGHEFKNAQKDILPIAATVSEDVIRFAVGRTDSTQLKQALMLGYYTGLRPSEVARIRPEDIDHNSLTLKVRVTKTGQGIRIIAIPAVLSAWAMQHSWTTINQSSIQTRLDTLKRYNEQAFIGLTFETLRRNFASFMATAGVPDEAIDAHMGHTRGTVLNKHYKRDPMLAVNLMREHIDRVWSGADRLRIVK